MLKAIVLVLGGETYKPKLLAALSTAFRAFWSFSVGLLPCEIRTRSSASARMSTDMGRVTVRMWATRPLKMVGDIVDP